MTAIDERHHVSTFALDVYFANGQTGDEALARHVESCADCKGYLAQLAAYAQPPARPVVVAKSPKKRTLAGAALGAMALAAGIAVVVHSMQRETSEPYVASKGAPAAQAIVRSEGRSRIWDGRSPIHAGDAIAFRAGCEGFKQVTVASPSRSSWSRLFEGGCPSGSDPLPFTLVADDEPGDERIVVVFSGARLDDEALRSAASGRSHSHAAWVIEFVFPKAPRP
jgi:hypothetical protein